MDLNCITRRKGIYILMGEFADFKFIVFVLKKAIREAAKKIKKIMAVCLG